MKPQDADVASIERATLQAVAPTHVEHLPGWLLPMDEGTVGRARSAVPLSHAPPARTMLDTVIDCYGQRGHVPRLRLPEHEDWAPAHQHLQAQGFRREQPTLTQTATLDRLLALPAHTGATLQARPDADWMAMFLGEGFDPVDGASRSRALARAEGTLFASLHEQDSTLACGAAAYGHGWLSVHGLRTRQDQRGRGLASALMRAMADEAQRRGIQRVFLQVDAANLPALALYRRIGFQTAWRYAYWHPVVA